MIMSSVMAADRCVTVCVLYKSHSMQCGTCAADHVPKCVCVYVCVRAFACDGVVDVRSGAFMDSLVCACGCEVQCQHVLQI